MALAALLCIGVAGSAEAATSNISITPHNLSKSGPGPVKAPDTADGESQICVFCHTPHNANINVKGPLWNRSVAVQSYTRYTSASLDANSITDGFSDQPGGSSVLCLSCHDGMLALGNVNVLWGKPATITLKDASNNTVDKMPTGSGVLTGNTRNLQTDLSNDHPISITFNDALAAQDGEMQRLTVATQGSDTPAQRDKISGEIIGIRKSGYKPLLPLEPTGTAGVGQVQCATCHDPHLTAQKFLRANRFQVGTPSGGNFSEANDQICLACHTKLGPTWAESAHANPAVADETYLGKAATQRTFPGTPAVWQVACLNCHDTHTAQGSRRLLREGIEGSVTGTDAGSYRSLSTAALATELDKVSAIENTCYQCHTAKATKIIGTGNGAVPDIQTDFETTNNIHMPIKTADQTGGTTVETHNIRNADMLECRRNMGITSETEPNSDHMTAAQKAICDSQIGSHDNRHVECTDCHNPHRVRRSSTFYGKSSDATEGDKRTHNVGGPNGNIASGVLRGAWGVEPVYTTSLTTWPQNPDSFTVKKGDPGTLEATSRAATYLTREYQLCFKCHSSYSNGKTAADFPDLGNTAGGTPKDTNGMQKYTNVAAEFASVNASDNPNTSSTDQGEYDESTVASAEDNIAPQPAGSYPADTTPGTMTDETGTQNHRSWHPVMWPTGRTLDERRITSTTGYNFRKPFAASVGIQTMHCSDCHGHSASWTVDTGPNGATQGPHGSDRKFLLKGDWSTSTKIGTPQLCGNCHNPTASSTTGSGNGLSSQPSGFNNPGTDDGGGHGNAHDGKPCMRCHIAVPHGWKNKAFLVNLNCVGPEVAGKTSCDPTSTYANYPGSDGSHERTYTAAPYYISAFLRVRIWKASGNWQSSACGANGAKNPSGKAWMTQGNAC